MKKGVSGSCISIHFVKHRVSSLCPTFARCLAWVFNKHIKKQIVCGKSIGFSNEFSCKHCMSDANASSCPFFPQRNSWIPTEHYLWEVDTGQAHTPHSPIQCWTSFRLYRSVRLCFVYNSQVLLFAVAWLKCVFKHTRHTQAHTQSTSPLCFYSPHVFCGHSRCFCWWAPYSSDKACPMWLVK